MRVKASDPFKTEAPFNKSTYQTIASRLAALKPPIRIENHIAQNEKHGKTHLSTLETKDSTLDGINFIAVDPKLLAQELQAAKDQWGQKALASMKEDSDHWALKASFGKTIGTGWREVWRAAPYSSPATALTAPGKADNVMRMRFGTMGSSARFTALHCAVHEIGGQCNIHIDQTGFVLELPTGGVGLTPNLYDHIMNELLLKTDFRDWLAGKMPNKEAARIVKEVIRRLSIVFPNASNGYAGLEKTINSLRQPRDLGDALNTSVRILKPIGVTFDAYDNDRFKVQVTGSDVNGERAITVSLGGEW